MKHLGFLDVLPGAAWAALDLFICPMAGDYDQFYQQYISQPTKKEGTMSLEAQLGELNTNLKALIAVLSGGAALAAPAAAKAVPAADKKADNTKTSAALDYEKDVKPLALQVAKEKKREKLIEILGTFGVAQANLLKPEQFNGFITACNAALKA